VLVTGSSGLIGSEAVAFFDARGWEVIGVDNNMRRVFFGADGDTTWNLERLRRMTKRFTHHDLDIRQREAMLGLFAAARPGLIVHCAAQPSHDLARERPFDDFEVNALGTLNLLEATRQHCPESPFVFMSSNKVYGDAPNEKPMRELATRFDYSDPADADGIAEGCRVDAALHSLLGASKLAADVLVQEYGRYFGIPTVCYRGGCLTGPNHSGAELHGFLAYLARAVREGGPTASSGTAGSRSATTSTRTTSAPRCSPSTRRHASPPSTTWRRPRQQHLGDRGDRAARGAGGRRLHTSTSTSRDSATTSATSRTCGSSAPTTPAGASRARSTTSCAS
jgi:CDP-paratose 2-epimerase